MEFDIIYVSEISSIAAKVISKSFIKFAIIEKYYCVYQEAYYDIASQVANKNGNKQKTKHHNVPLQRVMLAKMFEAYAPLILAIDKDWLDYTYTNLYNIIHQIIQYLKKTL